MDTIKFIVILLFLISIYPFVIYPFLIFLISRIFKRKIETDPNFEPEISILVPVHNEERNIEPLVEAIKNSGYPLSKIQLIFGSDGSTDKTNEIIQRVAKENDFIDFYLFPRKGKNFVLNQLFSKAKHNIVLLVDADIRIPRGTIHNIVKYFADPNVGGVLTNLMIKRDEGSHYNLEESNTHQFLLNIRKWESDIYATVNNTGPCYAIRKELFVPIPNDRVCDDYFILLKVVTAGKRMVLAKEAIVYDIRERDNVWKEYHRKKRFSAGGISAILAVKELFKHPYLLFLTFSHKLLRWLSPFFATIGLILLLWFSDSQIQSIIFSIIGLFILLFLLGIVNLKFWKRKLSVLVLPLYIMVSVSGTVSGVIRALLGKQNASWTLEGLEN